MNYLILKHSSNSKHLRMRYHFLALTFGLVVGQVLVCQQVAMAAPQPVRSGEDSGVENLGSGLLEGLLEDLEDQLPTIEQQAPRQQEFGQQPSLPNQDSKRRGALQQDPSKPNEKSWLPHTDQLRRQMNQEIGGEDIGQQQPSPLTPIAQRMQSAAQLISVANKSSEQPAPLQKQVVADLDKLIAEMEKQCQGGGQCQPKPDEKEKQASKRSKPKPSKGSKPGKSASKPSQAAAKDSTTRMGSAPVANASGQSAEDLMKAAWGHLPARLREQMVQSSSDEFLPEYQEELEKYFQRLAEREASEGSE